MGNEMTEAQVEKSLDVGAIVVFAIVGGLIMHSNLPANFTTLESILAVGFNTLVGGILGWGARRTILQS